MNVLNAPRAFAGAPAGTTAAQVTPLAPTARFSLRAADPGAAAIALGIALPSRVGARARSGSRTALCLGPDEWLIEAPEAEAPALAETFAETARHTLLSAVDVSDREITLEISGPAALDLLAAGCPRDLAKMLVGEGARTIFDTAQIILTREDENRFNLTVWRSFEPHVNAILKHALNEINLGC